MAPTSILEWNQEKGPQKVREQGCGKEKDWLETGAFIDRREEEEEEVGTDGSWASLGPSHGIWLRDLRWPCLLYPLLQSAADSPGHLQQTHPTTLSRLTPLPCDSKGGAGLHQPSFTPHTLSSFLCHLPGWQSGLTLLERKGGTGLSRSPSRITFSYPGPCIFTKRRCSFLRLLPPPSLCTLFLSPSPVDLIVLMVRSELENQSILPPPHPLSHLPTHQ